MPYVQGYTHDVFISYAHVDNVALVSGQRWVETFQRNLSTYLNQILGRRSASIWMDKELNGNEEFSVQIEAALRESATLVVISSTGYLKSKWCEREYNAFLEAVEKKERSGSRIFIVEIDRLDRNKLPEVFRSRIAYPFWKLDENEEPKTYGVPVVDGLKEPEYFVWLNKLRRELAEELERLDHVPQAQRPPRQAIFLAEVTDDVEDYREQVEEYVTQAGLRVLPDTAYPRDNQAEYERRMMDDLKQSRAFVQLLGAYSGRKRVGWNARPLMVEFQQASAAGLPILQWRSRDLDLEKIRSSASEHFDMLVGQHVRACGIEEFKRAIVDEVQRREIVKPVPSKDILVFLNTDPQDRKFAESLGEMLRAEGVGYSLPLPGAGLSAKDLREDLNLNLLTCHGLIVVYATSSVLWVRRQLAYWLRILSEREQPLSLLGLIEGPPSFKENVSFVLPKMHTLNCRDGLHPDIVNGFVTALLKELHERDTPLCPD